MNAKAEVIPASQQPQGGQVVQASATTLLQVIQQAATNPQVDIDKMERLMAMHERMQAREAETAWNDAMAACQRELRQVAPDAFNSQTAAATPPIRRWTRCCARSTPSTASPSASTATPRPSRSASA
jgi:hypothetical protein